MRFIKTGFEIIEQDCHIPDRHLTNMFKHIEKCGRLCYKSDDKMTDESAEPFVFRMINNKHYAMLEHGTVYLTVNRNNDCFEFASKIMPGTITSGEYENIRERYVNNKYSRLVENNGVLFITTNFRVIVENGWLDDLEYISKPTKFHVKRVTVKFAIDRFTGEEFIRHRPFSFARESTRFCNYSKDKFGNEVTFTYVPWCSTDDAVEPEHNVEEWGTILPYNTNMWNAIDWWLWSLQAAETAYLNLIRLGWSPQQARVVLPCAISSPLIMSGFVDDWKHFFDLRALGKTGKPHPQAQELAEPLMKEFIDREYI